MKAADYERPNVICLGQKGFGFDIFLSQIASVIKRCGSVLCFGCGTGEEILEIAKFLKPRCITGCDFFDHADAWTSVATKIALLYGVSAEFKRIDLSNGDEVALLPKFDLIISNAVLEHLSEMGRNFMALKTLLAPSGQFASQWGPMWHSYGGDHISSELGFSKGFEHLRLSSSEYLAFYRAHPRNRDMVARGEPTWLELGLHNLARYDEYISQIEMHFGPIRWLKWQLSSEALRWHERRPEDWNRMLRLDPNLQPLDLVLSGAAAMAGGD